MTITIDGYGFNPGTFEASASATTDTFEAVTASNSDTESITVN